MNWYSIFYLITRADDIKGFFDTASNLFTAFAVVSFIVWIFINFGKAATVSEEGLKSEEEQAVNSEYRSWVMGTKIISKFFYLTLTLSLICWAGYVVTPTKKEALFIVAGGAVGNFLVSDTSAAQIPSDITTFLHLSLKEEISELSMEAKKELGVMTPKEQLLDNVRSMGKEELIRFLESDTTLIK
jgi:hypothetical protein